MSDTAFEVRRRVFFFGSAAEFHVHVHQGKRGRWRWSVQDADTERYRVLTPVRGWETEAEAIADARDFFGRLDVQLTEVQQ